MKVSEEYIYAQPFICVGLYEIDHPLMAQKSTWGKTVFP